MNKSSYLLWSLAYPIYHTSSSQIGWRVSRYGPSRCWRAAVCETRSMAQPLRPDRERSIRVDLRLITIGALVVGIGSLVTLLVVAGSDADLAKTALVLAVVAFIADLVIALASYMIASQAEARLQETNAQMQRTLGAIQEQSNEIRNLARSQVTDLIDRLAPRVVEDSEPEDRLQVRSTLEALRNVASQSGSLQVDTLALENFRRDAILRNVREWAEAKGLERGPEFPHMQLATFRANDVLYVHTSPRRQGRRP
jgi:hypothetical protein